MSLNTAIAVNRFGLGARPGELAGVDEPAGWLLAQLERPARPATDLAALGTTNTVLAEVLALRRERNAMRKNGQEVGRDYAQLVRRHHAAQVLARYREAALSEQPFRERLVHFFANHFAVSADKQPLPAVAGLFENEAIRPHVTGRFAELLIAVEQHPAMLTYLDNQRSIGPGSRAGRASQRRRPENAAGLNENLAREILELHTLGVDGGYTQADVTALAKIITGWSITAPRDLERDRSLTVGEFRFREFAHEPGSQRLLGRSYGDDGLDQGEAALRDLARHPATARHVSFKLARHFVADTPPGELVDAMAATWLDTDGDLAAVMTTLVEHPASWEPAHRKYKSPHDFVISSFRAFDAAPERAPQLFGSLEQLGQPPYRPGSPAGWPDTAEDWGSPDALYKRIEWAGGVGRLIGRRVNPLTLAEDVLGAALTDTTRRSLRGAESIEQGLTLLLASPDFLRR